MKSLRNQEKINFNSVLEKTATITYDRSLLMNWINEKYEIRSNEFKTKIEKNTFKVKSKNKSILKENEKEKSKLLFLDQKN